VTQAQPLGMAHLEGGAFFNTLPESFADQISYPFVMMQRTMNPPCFAGAIRAELTDAATPREP